MMARRNRNGFNDFLQGFIGTYGIGRKIAEDFRNDQMRDELSKVEAIGGPSQTDVASGEEAIAGAQQARGQAIAAASTPEEKAAAAKDFEPTMAALEAQRSRPAGVVNSIGIGAGFRQQDKPFTPDEAIDAKMAAREGIYRSYGKDDEADRLQDRRLSRKVMGLQIDEANDRADTRKKLREVDGALRDWGQKNIQTDADGKPILNDDALINLGKMRVFELGKRGLYDDAMKTAEQSMQYATRKIQSEQVERQAAVRDAVAAAGMGDYSKAMEVYNRFVPDGSKAVAVKPNKDGSFTVERVSSVDGMPLSSGTFKNLDHLVSSINGLADSNALTAYVDRTFKHDIESRRLGIEGGRLQVAKDAETRAAGKDSREEARMNAVLQGLGKYAEAEANGDTKGMNAARRTILANGGKLDKPEMPKADVKVGQLGDITVSQPTGGGGVQVTNYGPDMKTKGSVMVPPPGAATAAVATPKTQADFDKLPSGAIYVDPQDGKKYRKP